MLIDSEKHLEERATTVRSIIAQQRHRLEREMTEHIVEHDKTRPSELESEGSRSVG